MREGVLRAPSPAGVTPRGQRIERLRSIRRPRFPQKGGSLFGGGDAAAPRGTVGGRAHLRRAQGKHSGVNGHWHLGEERRQRTFDTGEIETAKRRLGVAQCHGRVETIVDRVVVGVRAVPAQRLDAERQQGTGHDAPCMSLIGDVPAFVGGPLEQLPAQPCR